MKRKVLIIISVIVLLVGVSVLLYPPVSKGINTYKSERIVEDFKKDIEELNEKTTETSEADTNSSSDGGDNTNEELAGQLDPQLIAQLYNDLQKYNQDLYNNGQQDEFANSFIFEDPTVDLTKYGITNGIIGCISVPEIDLNLPIYLGANEGNMALGASQLNKTSAPIGGENTNCAIAGHRGLPNQVMFDNIVYLTEGDDVYITNYWDNLHYKVIETKIIDPDATNEILIEDNKDLLTLITCHPYGYTSQRYLVICERVE